METIFRGQHLHIDDQFRKYATQRLNRLTRYLSLVDHAIVDLRREAKGSEGRFVVQITVSANGAYFRAEERNFDLAAAVDAATDALSQQAKRFKGKKLLRSERRVSKYERLPFAGSPEATTKALPRGAELIMGRVVRTKRFAMKPMTEAEAIEQMELLGHNFFLFEDVDKDTLALLYRRKDGDYGMILPETA